MALFFNQKPLAMEPAYSLAPLSILMRGCTRVK